MGGLLSRKKPSRVTEQDKAILQLKQQRDKMKQYQHKIELLLEKEKQVARELLTKGKKDKALLLLRKKKYQENLLTKTDAQLDNIAQMIENLEFAQVEMKVIEGLKKGNESLKMINEALKLEDVEQILDETAESSEFQKEITSLLSGGLTDMGEEDALAELDELLKSSELPNLPEVPMEKLPGSLERISENQQERRRELVTS